MLPERIRTGFRDTTIPNPAYLHRRDRAAKTFVGDAKDYSFERQTENFKKLRAILQANGTDFAEVASAHYQGDLHTNHRFVVSTKDGSLLWHKYVGFAAQSGQNHVFVKGRRIKVSCFVELTDVQQRALLSGNETYIGLSGITSTRLKLLDEAGTLWN
jgi:hypothetical protein